MLSRALQKANTAVLLDNAQNFEGAMEAYADACHLLQQVMRGSTREEDKKKLRAIRKTYTTRINELHTLDLDVQQARGKALPQRPLSDDTLSPEPFPSHDGDEEPAVIETATATRIMGGTYTPAPRQTRFLEASQIPPHRQSLLPSAFESGNDFHASLLGPESLYPGDWSPSVPRSESMDAGAMEPECMPPPLSISPRKPISPDDFHSRAPAPSETETRAIADATEAHVPHHSRDTSTETTSWLDTIDDSGGSSVSSLHSRHSSFKVHRKRTDIPTGDSEAELSAAMDAAVEAAYDDSFDIPEELIAEDDSEVDMALKARRNVEQARQKVREAEQEDLVQEQRRGQDEQVTRRRNNSIELDYLDEEAAEEERLLEEMTKGYIMDDFQFGIQSKSAVPHHSDSSGFSGRTWGSSNSSQTIATAPSIAGLVEGVQGTFHQKIPPPYPPPHPPPAGALPRPPASASVPPVPPAPSLPPPRPPSLGGSPGPGVRDRRLSRQHAKQLKIETHSRPSSGSAANNHLPIKTQIPLVDEESVVPADSSEAHPIKAVPSPRPPVPQVIQAPPLTPLTSIHSGSSMQSESPATPALTRTGTQDGDEPVPASPARFMGKSTLPNGLLRKNMSSSSLKMRNLSVITADISEISPITPASATFSVNNDLRKGMTAATPVMPTPTGNVFTVNGGMYLFDDQICSPTTPSSPHASISNAPFQLEPCPESFLLRPFWLMRSLYQTIAHPRGGYLSPKLFVPRDVWRVKNVKIKGIEDKISNCDLLTAALLKLSRVDTLDADAVLEEMQSFETVLDQVRNILQKKLGSEVGLQSSAVLFKASPATDDAGAQADAFPSRNGNATNKSYLSSWRKLRTKNSGAALTSSYTTLPSREGNKETLSMSSLPMTSIPSSRPHKRNISQLQLTGPNAHYMGALARLFDAVQILDQIARQVEDPGLKYSSKTHVGLELSTRNAAEFFGFYVCRFALNDVSLMLDKFIKRGSEWVLA